MILSFFVNWIKFSPGMILTILFIFSFTVSESISNGSAIFAPDNDSDEEWGLIAEFMDPMDVENTTINSMLDYSMRVGHKNHPA
jgi:hypothetical protein